MIGHSSSDIGDARELLKRGRGLSTLNGMEEKGRNPLPSDTTSALGLITPQTPLPSPLAQDRVFFSIWLLPLLDSICFLCMCLIYVAEKIELPNSTSTEVEMTPSSDASEPVQNGNLSHSIEAAEAQVCLFSIALPDRRSCRYSNTAAQT